MVGPSNLLEILCSPCPAGLLGPLLFGRQRDPFVEAIPREYKQTLNL